MESQTWDNILKLIEEWNAYALVVGLPLNMDGTWQHTSYASKKSANGCMVSSNYLSLLKLQRLTSVQAKRDLKREKQLDSYAAKLIIRILVQQSASFRVILTIFRFNYATPS